MSKHIFNSKVNKLDLLTTVSVIVQLTTYNMQFDHDEDDDDDDYDFNYDNDSNDDDNRDTIIITSIIII